MLVEVNCRTTKILLKKEEESRLITAVNKVTSLQYEPYEWSNNGYYFFNRVLTPREVSELKKGLEATKSKETISGFYGDLITGFDLKWK